MGRLRRMGARFAIYIYSIYISRYIIVYVLYVYIFVRVFAVYTCCMYIIVYVLYMCIFVRVFAVLCMCYMCIYLCVSLLYMHICYVYIYTHITCIHYKSLMYIGAEEPFCNHPAAALYSLSLSLSLSHTHTHKYRCWGTSLTSQQDSSSHQRPTKRSPCSSHVTN
jgi:hypothetical protein